MKSSKSACQRRASMWSSPCGPRTVAVQFACWTKSFSQCDGEATMPEVKQTSKRKRVTKAAVPALGAAGLTFSLVGGASAAVAPVNDVPQTPNYSPSHAITLGEEEIADVSLATFYVFDKEAAVQARPELQLVRGGCGGGGCGGRGCGVGGCGCWGGCGCGCCLSWGGCRFC